MTALTPLCELAQKHGTDKFKTHRYTPTYYAWLKDRIGGVRRVFEVGVAKGRSLRMWEEFFPNALIFGFDRNAASMIHGGRVHTFLGDQNNIISLHAAAISATADGPLDFVVDDGAHRPGLQLSTAQALLPFLAPDGLYFIEDVIRGANGDDDPEQIIGHLPKGFKAKRYRTGNGVDDVLILIRRRRVKESA